MLYISGSVFSQLFVIDLAGSIVWIIAKDIPSVRFDVAAITRRWQTSQEDIVFSHDRLVLVSDTDNPCVIGYQPSAN